MRKILPYLLLLLGYNLAAQTIPQQVLDQIENFIETREDSEIDVDDLLALYSTLLQQQLDLNTVSYEDLVQLQFLDEIKIQSFLDYRTTRGPIIALEELQAVPNWSLDDAKLISTFIGLSKNQRYQLPLLQMASQGKHVVYSKMRRVLNEQAGYSGDMTKTQYLGDQNNLSLRYRYNYENKMRYGFILEKDAGEAFPGNNKIAFDYASVHFYLKDYSTLLKDLAIGDYTIGMGQGLIVQNSFGGGKSAWVNAIKTGGRPIAAYNSVSETLYNRGIAARLNPVEHLDVTLFGSLTNKDAGLAVLDTMDFESSDILFSSFLASGYHRTETELAKKHQLQEIKYGGILKYYQRNFHIAFNIQRQSFDATFKSADQLYNLYRFTGSELTNTSVDYSYRFKNLNFFGEVAKSFPGGMAQLHGLLIGLDRHVSMSMLYRNYAPDYHATLPNAFGEGSSVSNEAGLYMGLEIKPNYNWNFRFYADVWKHQWLRFQVDAPTTGREYLARIDYTIKRKLNAYIQYIYENKSSNYSNSLAKIDAPQSQVRERLRLHVSNKVSKELELRSRLEFSRFTQNEVSKGIAVMQDIIYKPVGFPLSLTSRIALFDTDNYDSRVYAYENDLLFEFYIPAYSGQGLRYYLNLRYDITRMITAEFRYANTRYSDRDVIGSGLDFIDNNVKSDIKAQLRFTF